MSWMVVDPRYSTVPGTKVARIDIPFFPDEIEYETILGKAFQDEKFDEWRMQQGVLILATPTAYDKMEELMGSNFTDVPELTVREEVRKLCLERQAVVLKWMAVQ